MLLTELAPVGEASIEQQHWTEIQRALRSECIQGSRRVGSGSAATAQLDWKEAAKERIPSDRSEELFKAGILMAAEAVCLHSPLAHARVPVPSASLAMDPRSVQRARVLLLRPR